MKKNLLYISTLVASMLMVNCSDDDDNNTPTEIPDVIPPVEVPAVTPTATQEASLLLASIATDGGVPFSEATAVDYPAIANVFIPSALGLDYRLDRNIVSAGPTVRLPLFKGWETTKDGPREAHYIITESSDEAQARQLGIIYAPRMAAAIGSNGVQKATWTTDGRLVFEGSVDFSGTRDLVAGGADGLLLGFPPASVTPGAVADENWSSYVVLPSGTVINAQLMANSTGIHDRIPNPNGNTKADEDDQNNPNLDRDGAAVVLQILDGWHDDKPYFFHIVTDTSEEGPSAIELGVFAPKLRELPTFGLFPGGSMLPFSPTANGVTPDANDPDGFQGLNTASLSNRQENDPTNTFPIDPSNQQYSPMWDAHITEFTVPVAERVILKSFNQVNDLLADGTLIPFRGNSNPSPLANSLSNMLTATGAIINCPVISQPLPSAIGQQYGAPTN